MDEDQEALRRLASLGLVEHTRRGYAALDPRVAMQRLLAEEQEAVRYSIQRMERIAELEALAADFDPNRLWGGPASEFMPSRTLMNARIGEALEQITAGEFLSVQPGQPQDRDPAVHRLGVQRAKALLDRGVAVRSLYPPGGLEHEGTRAYVADLLEAGAGVRVGAILPPRMMIVGTSTLFIDNAVMPAERDAGWCVVDIASVAWARMVFDTAWAACTPWEQAVRSAAVSVTTARQRAILRAMAAGELQEAVGAVLGLSIRTVNKELGMLRDQLGLLSTYQLMAWWPTSDDRSLP
ncbi:hypothetical protein [Streptomyces sp. NPDC048242]|uniref:hypothetical protein n=1 Tax=Streptomyces sp. NPDC048242 TaxID=3155026 RepID=UPI003423D242